MGDESRRSRNGNEPSPQIHQASRQEIRIRQARRQEEGCCAEEAGPEGWRDKASRSAQGGNQGGREEGGPQYCAAQDREESRREEGVGKETRGKEVRKTRFRQA